MRQGQQHIRRGRGRNNNHGGNNNSTNGNINNNRKNQNPLTRSFESNGPDVKIRGNPMHIAEKYIQLARDAQSAGDPVLAENYLQHAEHYNRIIMAHRDSVTQQSPDHSSNQFPRGRVGYAGEQVDGQDELGDDQGDDMHSDGGQSGGAVGRPQSARGHEPQPRFGDRDQQPPIDSGYSGGGQDHQPGQTRNGRDNRFDNRPDTRQDTRPDNRPEGRDGRNEGRQGQRRRPFRDRYNHDNRGQDSRGPDGRGQGGDRPQNDRQQNDRMAHDRGGPERMSGSGDRPSGDRMAADRPLGDRPLADRVSGDRPVHDPLAAPLASAPAPEPRAYRAPPVDRDTAPVAERREPRAERPRRAERAPVAAAEPGFDAQPDFLRRPVRRPRREAPVEDTSDGPATTGVADDPGAPDKTPV